MPTPREQWDSLSGGTGLTAVVDSLSRPRVNWCVWRRCSTAASTENGHTVDFEKMPTKRCGETVTGPLYNGDIKGDAYEFNGSRLEQKTYTVNSELSLDNISH